MNNRMSALESQIGKLEIVLGALPLWKEELVSCLEQWEGKAILSWLSSSGGFELLTQPFITVGPDCAALRKMLKGSL